MAASIRAKGELVGLMSKGTEQDRLDLSERQSPRRASVRLPHDTPHMVRAPKNIHYVQSVDILKDIVQHPGAHRVGVTNNPARRKYQYDLEDVSNKDKTMYYTRTNNKKKTEDDLLETGRHFGTLPLNIQQRSNAQRKPGYAYVLHDE